MDYANGKIYCIRNHVNDEVYVGSTCTKLCKRMVNHRGAMKRYCDRPLYKLMSELGVEHFYIELVEECPCDNKEQLLKREGHYIREMGTLNKLIAGREKKEYRKEYSKQNKDKIKEQNKEYYEQNKEQIKEHKKEYYEQNKDKINTHSSEKIACDVCGANVSRRNMNRHKKTIKCQSHK